MTTAASSWIGALVQRCSYSVSGGVRSAAVAVKFSLERPSGQQSTRGCVDKPQPKYIPLSDRKSDQIHTGKEVNF